VFYCGTNWIGVSSRGAHYGSWIDGEKRYRFVSKEINSDEEISRERDSNILLEGYHQKTDLNEISLKAF
jgi:hypothetical protein